MFLHRQFILKRGVVLASLLVAAGPGAQAGQYSNAYFFGDSLTDSGVFTAVPGVGSNNHFSTNPGTVWAQNVGARYGVSVTPAYATVPTPVYTFTPIASGNDFAVGMGRINLPPTLAASDVNIPPLSAQVTDFLARGAADPSALYALSGGHNDIITQFMALPANGGTTSLADAQAAIVTAANDLVAQVARLQAAGVRNLIVVGITDITKTPFGQSYTGTDLADLQTLVSTFNSALTTGLAGKNLLYFDTGRLLDTMMANPAAFGITNTTDGACGFSLGCVPPASTNGYLFADPKHPSAIGHQVISDWVYSSLEAASNVGLLSQVAMRRADAQWRSIDARLQEFENFGYKGQGVFFSSDYAYAQRSESGALPSGNDSGTSFILGYEKAFDDRLFGGVTLSYGHAPFDLPNDQGSVKYTEWALSAFGAYKFGAFYANALASYSRLDFASTRTIALGSFNTEETGDTGGNRFAAKGQVGYNFVSGSIVHGPLAGLAWARVDVDGFSEKSDSVTAMTYGDQTRESLRSRLGWQVATETLLFGARLRPYAQLSYDYEHKNDERTYRVGFVGGTSGMDMPTSNLTGGYGTVLAGVNAELSKTMRLGIGASTTINQPGERLSAVTVTLSAPF